MIARIWRGAVAIADSDAYAQYMQHTGVRGYAETRGSRGVWMLRRTVDDKEEFVMFTLWDSLEAIKPSPARTRRGPSSIRKRAVPDRTRRGCLTLRGRDARLAECELPGDPVGGALDRTQYRASRRVERV